MDSFELLKKLRDNYTAKNNIKSNLVYRTLSKPTLPKPKLSTEECAHENVHEDEDSTNWCLSCGVKLKVQQLYVQTYTNHKPQTRCAYKHPTHSKSIREDIKKYEIAFPDDIINTADQIFQFIIDQKSPEDGQKTRAYRGQTRLSIICGCIYEAYMCAGKPQNICRLGKQLQLKRKNILSGLFLVQKAIILFKKKNNIPVEATNFITPMVEIKHILKSGYNVQDGRIDDIQKLHDMVMKRKTDFSNSNVSSIAAGILFFYMVKEEMNITVEELSKKMRISPTTIIARAKIVAEISGREDLIPVLEN